jgi:hypothetical protein
VKVTQHRISGGAEKAQQGFGNLNQNVVGQRSPTACV